MQRAVANKGPISVCVYSGWLVISRSLKLYGKSHFGLCLINLIGSANNGICGIQTHFNPNKGYRWIGNHMY